MAGPATSTSTEVKLGPHLKGLRAKAGLSQGALAVKVGIDVTYLSKLENGRQRASERVLRALADVLDVEPAHLLVMAGRIPAELQGTFQASVLGDPPLAIQGFAPPRYRATFINRDDDFERLRKLIERPGRLITVTGPPGCGKSRLLAELAATMGPVAWLTVRENDATVFEAALDETADMRGGILVLDDAERNLAACASIARAKVAAGTTVVATSRQALGMYGEQLLRLEPLPVPDRHQRPGADDQLAAEPGRLSEQESVRLFVERAALAIPGFQLDRTNATAVFDVCRWLDGLPLAIELAAMRLRQVTVADLAASTRMLLPWLKGNTPDVPDRHASFASAIEWSFATLDGEQRTVATRLSLLESPFSREDAIEVASDDNHSGEVVVATVMDLVDCCLLQREENPDGHAVYRWLRPIRQYVRRCLEAQADDCKKTIERHRMWVISEFAQLDRDLPRLGSEWGRMAELTPELVSAVHNLPAAERAGALNRIAQALTKSLQFGNVIKHVDHFDEFDWQLSSTAPGLLRESGTLARLRGDLDAAYKDFEDSYQLALASGDEGAEANAALDLGENASARLDYDAAEKYIKRAAELYEKLEDVVGQIEVLNLRGKVLMKQLQPAAAEEVLLDALGRAQTRKDNRLIAYSLHSLGTCDYLLRRINSARDRLQESLKLRVNMRNQRGCVRVIEVLALVESEVRNHELVLQLLGAGRQYRHSSGITGVTEWWKERLDAAEQEARVSVGATPGRAEQLLLDGSAMTLVQAGTLAAAPAAGFKGPLGVPVAEPLRRRISPPGIDREELAQEVAAGARDTAPTELDLASQELAESGSPTAAEAYGRLHRANLLALGEPVDALTADMLCFAVDPKQYRGVIIPVFASGHALAAALERCPDWATRRILEVQLDQLRSTLVRGEVVIVNPWTEYEYRVASAERPGYALSADGSTQTEAPTAQSRSTSAS